MSTGENISEEEYEKKRQERERLGYARQEVSTALGLCLQEDDLDTLWKMIEEGDENRDKAVLRATRSMREKAVERFWVRALSNARGEPSQRGALSILGARGSADVIADLCAYYEASPAEERDKVLEPLSLIVSGNEDSSPLPRFESSLSEQELDALKVRIRALLASYFASLPEGERSRSGWDEVTPVMRLAAATAFPGLREHAVEAVRKGAWECRDVTLDAVRLFEPHDAICILIALERYVEPFSLDDYFERMAYTKSERAIPVLRKYLDDRTDAHVNDRRVCDCAAIAIEGILNAKTPLWRYASDEEKLKAIQKKRDARCQELLKLTAEADKPNQAES